MAQLDTISMASGIVGGAVLIPTTVYGWYKGWFESPHRKTMREAAEEARSQARLVADAILGEREIRDRSGNIITRGEPGLVARTRFLEEGFATLADQQGQINRLIGRVDGHESAIGMLKRATEERTEIRRESAALMDMVSKRDSDVIDPQTEP